MLQRKVNSKLFSPSRGYKLLLGSLLLILGTSCQEMASSGDAKKDKASGKVDSLNATAPMADGAMEDTLEMAYNQRDPNLFRCFYAVDAVSYGEAREQIFGRSNLLANFRQTVVNNENFNSRFRYHTLDVFVPRGSEQAVETGKWVETDTTGEEQDHGFYMVLFELRDGRYVSVRDMWNTSTPDE